jgi:hypothetical protein
MNRFGLFFRYAMTRPGDVAQRGAGSAAGNRVGLVGLGILALGATIALAYLGS